MMAISGRPRWRPNRRMRKQLPSFATKVAIIASMLLLIWYSTTSISSLPALQQAPEEAPKQVYNSSTKKILMWNKFFHYDHFGYDIRRPLFEDLNCAVTNCHIWDATDGMPDDIPVEDFDLLWFHGVPAYTLWFPSQPENTMGSTRPRKRKPNQVYLFYLFESPDHDLLSDYQQLGGFFNWTATYRTDSDIFMPYGWFINKTLKPVLNSKPDTSPTFIQPRFDNITTQVASKTKLVYWMVSNCLNVPSNRDIYVEELSQNVPVDIYGRCGTPCTGNLCDRDVLVSTYKFYLAFENSMCEDYITEKFYGTMYQDVVPVVYGGGDYARHAPPHSYIDARDFETPRDLAVYLRFLDGNDAEYRKYFWWKDYYVPRGDKDILCTMCAMLNDPPPAKVVDDLEGWWKGGGKCVRKPVGLLRHINRLFLQFGVLRYFCLGVFLCVICVVGIVLLKNRSLGIIRRMLNSPYVPVKGKNGLG